MLITRLVTLSGLAMIACFMAAPASALSMTECSAKYNAAKEAGTLGGQTWTQFRKAECAANAGAATQAAKPDTPATTADPAKGLSMKECSAKYKAAKGAGTLGGQTWTQFRKAECAANASPAAATAKPDNKTAKAAKGLSMKECSAKYNAAKDAGTLGGQTWTQFRKAECAASASPAAATTKPSTAAKPSGAANAEPGKGLSMKECSTKYSAAKTAGTLGSQTWNQFRKAECGASAAEDETVPNLDQSTYGGEPEKPAITAPRGVKFPTAVDSKFTNETPGKARMHTCLEQYYANKDANALGGLKWIQKGGGYYSLCNAKLKG